MKRTFPVKVSWWLFGPIQLMLLGVAVREAAAGQWVSGAWALASAGLVLAFVLSTRYTLTDTTLLVQSGPFRWDVPVQQIRRVVPSRNRISSPAPSLDRLLISYNQYDSVLISPRDKAGLIHALKQLNPTIQLD